MAVLAAGRDRERRISAPRVGVQPVHRYDRTHRRIVRHDGRWRRRRKPAAELPGCVQLGEGRQRTAVQGHPDRLPDTLQPVQPRRRRSAGRRAQRIRGPLPAWAVEPRGAGHPGKERHPAAVRRAWRREPAGHDDARFDRHDDHADDASGHHARTAGRPQPRQRATAESAAGGRFRAIR